MYKLCDDAAKSRSVRYSAAYPTGAERSVILTTKYTKYTKRF